MKATTAVARKPKIVLKDHLEKAVAFSFSADLGTPVGLFEKLSRQHDFAFLFESTEGDARLARYSFLSYDPCLTVSIKDGTVSITDAEGKREEQIDQPLDYLQKILEQFKSLADTAIESAMKSSSGENNGHSELSKFLRELPFIGGLVGYMGYGANQYMAGIKQQESDPTAVPDGCYGLYDSVIVFDHQFRRVIILSLRGEKHANSMMDAILSPGTLKPLKLDLKVPGSEEIFARVTASVTKEKFLTTVQQAKEYLAEGQAFQIVVSQRFSVPAAAPPINIYRMLQATNPSPYAYFLKFPDFVYLGSSPETFVQCQNKKLMLRAIAGTRRRGESKEQDVELGHELRADEKEMAEHRMLVDLGRNDLGRVSTPG